MSTRGWKAGLLVATLLCGACAESETPKVIAAVGQQLAGTAPAQVNAAAWADTQAFYKRHSDGPVWVIGSDARRIDSAMQLVSSAKTHGLEPAEYGEERLVQLRAQLNGEDAPEKASDERVQSLAEFDVRLTAALLSLGHDVALGRSKPERIDPRWKAHRDAPDFVGTLTTAMESGLSTWLDTIKPRHPQYTALQKALMDPAMAQHAGQIALNLERWRWMPDELGTRHIIVNIPSFHLAAREGHRTVLEMKVVVGKPENKTPIFSDAMTTTVFSPYWNVPDSIAEGETAPAAARDPGFLKRNNMEILRRTTSGTQTVDPSTVKWDDPEELEALAFRQKPGATNALGHVKFLFPNPYDVYLHDTPADALFERRGRAFSHGCVRVEQPEALAKWVLQDSPQWTDEKIVEAMHAGEEQHVKLKQPIPVHIVYFTAWADDAGTVRVVPDVYGFDAAQSSR